MALLADDLRDRPVTAPEPGRGLLPGWTASLTLHAALLVVAAFGLRSCTGGGQRGEADGDWRAVGLITRTNESDSDADSGSDTAVATAEPTPDPAESPSTISSDALAAPDAPPAALAELPGGDLPPFLGPGSTTPAFSGPAGAETSPTGPVGTAPAAPGGLARGETRFLNITDKGTSFVYVVDSSGSMASHNAIAFAKAELMASLEALDGDQRFHVIFYNDNPRPMRLPGKPAADSELYWASDINRTLARQFIAGIDADMGTNHLPALTAALALKPDVIFFLTDAADLSARDIDAVRRANLGRTRLHAVEFGEGPRLKSESPLERLARENGGVYQYRDVTRLGRR